MRTTNGQEFYECATFARGFLVLCQIALKCVLEAASVYVVEKSAQLIKNTVMVL